MFRMFRDTVFFFVCCFSGRVATEICCLDDPYVTQFHSASVLNNPLSFLRLMLHFQFCFTCLSCKLPRLSQPFVHGQVNTPIQQNTSAWLTVLPWLGPTTSPARRTPSLWRPPHLGAEKGLAGDVERLVLAANMASFLWLEMLLIVLIVTMCRDMWGVSLKVCLISIYYLTIVYMHAPDPNSELAVWSHIFWDFSGSRGPDLSADRAQCAGPGRGWAVFLAMGVPHTMGKP